VEDLRRLVVVSQDDGVVLSLQGEDGVDIPGKGGPFGRRDDALDPFIELIGAGEGGFVKAGDLYSP
jgi:hypothetical protein